MSEPVVLEVFSDYVCPWCYLVSARVARLKKEHGVKVELVHFPLHPETPAEGKSLQELFAGRGYDIPKLQAQMRARMQAEGLPYGDRKMTYNSRLAQELGKWADTQPGGEAIHDALFPHVILHAGVAELTERGHLGQRSKARAGRHGERPQAQIIATLDPN